MEDTPCTAEDRARIAKAAQDRAGFLLWLADMLTARWDQMSEQGRADIRKYVADELRLMSTGR